MNIEKEKQAKLTLGSLFDGSGGFPLAGTLCGIEPLWASEVEPYPIAVTRSRFPNMKHLGDVSKIRGYDIDPVDIVTFGSPCQDLSVAGKRAGLKHEANGDSETTRSGLFMEAVRIIREMREATNGIYPTFAIWENVPGAFSSNGGEDFRIVLEELVKIVEPNAAMPPVPKGGWAYADSYYGDGWSIAYRTFDAQYWGVPQRRRRIYLVADFRNTCAGKILFERDGLRGHFEESGTPWETLAAAAENGIGADDREGESIKAFGFPLGFRPENVRVYEETSTTLCNGTRPGFTTGIITAFPVCYDARGNGDGDKASTITGDHENRITDYTSIVIEPFCKSALARNSEDATTWKHGKVANTLNTFDHGEARANELVVAGVDLYNQVLPGKVCKAMTASACDSDHVPCALTCQNTGHGRWKEGDVAATIRTPCGGDSTLANVATETRKVDLFVRRLTPTECARLQGFPDKWGHPNKIPADTTGEVAEFWRSVYLTDCSTNGKKPKSKIADKQDGWELAIVKWHNNLHTDSSEYKMWGNGIALPTALYVMQGIADQCG